MFRWLDGCYQSHPAVLPHAKHSPYFRVPHESITETDCQTMGVKRAVAVFLRDRVHVGRVAGVDRIALHAFLRCDAPAIVDAMDTDVSCRRDYKLELAHMRQTLFLTSGMVDESEWGDTR